MTCRGCGIRPTLNFYDRCSHCSTRHLRDRLGNPSAPKRKTVKRKHCNRCYDRKPMPGTVWCLKCAVAAAERLRGTDPNLTDAMLDARIASFKARTSPGSGRGRVQ